MLKRLWRQWAPNPLDLRLKRAAKRRVESVLIIWNRGMGDLPLGLFAIRERVRAFLPEAQLTFLVRSDLVEAFSLLGGVRVWGAEGWKRGAPFDLRETLAAIGSTPEAFGLILEDPDPTYWVRWQLGTLTPKLQWDPTHDQLADAFDLDGSDYIALHVHTETQYGYEKNWPLHNWQLLCKRLICERGAKILLFGMRADAHFEMERVVDLRGRTTLCALLSLIKNRCSHLIAPDSGVLSLVYYLDTSFPLRVISLWADPRQGVLKQGVASPNPELIHRPLLGREEKTANIAVEEVWEALELPLVDPLLKQQQRELFSRRELPFRCAPLTKWALPPQEVRGRELLSEGKLACLVLAGGQGVRLGAPLSKGLLPVTPVRGKTLIQLVCEKTRAASAMAGTPLSVALMTSPLNHQAIADYLREQGAFGLEREQLSLFSQEMLPFLDDAGHWVVQADGRIARGPDGNGSALAGLVRSGVLAEWKARGVEHVHVVLIDNPLADPFDAALLLAHRNAGAEVTLKCVPRAHPEEQVGVVAEEEGRIRVVEYFELPDEVRSDPRWHVANAGLFCMRVDFIERNAEKSLPWHLARKGGLWKFERFLFDLLPYARCVEVVLYPREEVYAPLKNASGEASLDSVRAALLEADRRIYSRLSGLSPPAELFELDPAFHYPTPELIERWKGRELPDSDYIDNLLV